MSAVTTPWGNAGPSLKWPRATLTAIVVLSLVSLGLGAGLIAGVNRTPLALYTINARYPSRGRLFAIDCVVPLVTVFAAGTELAVSFFSVLLPLASLVVALIYIAVWSYIWSVWFGCEYGRDLGGTEVCEFHLLRTEPFNGSSPIGSGEGLFVARLTFGMLVVAAYLVHVGLASAALDRNVKAAKAARNKAKGVGHA